jgi:hypothetical protein
MGRRVVRFAFLLCILAMMANRSAAPLSARAFDDYCECYWSAAYLYEVDPVYGPWIFVDQANPSFVSFYIAPEEDFAQDICFDYCWERVVQAANNLCNLYGFEAHHWSGALWFYFEDPDDDDGGTVFEYYANQPTVRMCADWF